MKVLWLCNTPLPEAAKALGYSQNSKEGWLIGISNQLIVSGKVELVILYPQAKFKRMMKTKGKSGIVHYGYYEEVEKPYEIQESVETEFKKILTMEKPDIVHIFGTEFAHSLIMLRAVSYEKCIVSIQGIVSLYSEHYLDGIKEKDYLFPCYKKHKFERIYDLQKKFALRGKVEKDIIRKCDNFIGRTHFDKFFVHKINRKAKYYHCNEIMRDSFYVGQWDMDHIERHTIFISQGNYAIKGLHNVLKVLSGLVKRFPDIKVYVAGGNAFYKADTRDSYGCYIERELRKNKLEQYVQFVGMLSESGMRKYLLKTNVFVIPSNIENSPNSLAEAMLLGVPCIASFVGGIGDMVKHGSEGLLYPKGELNQLEGYISEIFTNRKLAMTLSENARARAKVLYDRKSNSDRLIEIYENV